jgi:glutamyl-tRNA(Gln) amidotransferase subunit D
MDVYEKLKEKNIEVGDKIKIDDLVGILMPKTEFDEEDILILKLENGYNIGIKVEDLEKIELLEKKEKAQKIIKEVKFDPSKPKILILGCGGTIMSKIDYRTGAVHPSFSVEDLLEMFPEIYDIANVKTKSVFNVFSENMKPENWIAIAKEIEEECKKENFDGIVILHGTDTMHYTAAALSFMLQDLPFPVVLVGAQRSSDRPSSDSKINLLNAIYFAAYSDCAEVVVCMHENLNDEYCAIHRGTKVRKMHTSRRDAFKSINIKPIARVNYLKREIQYLEKYKKRDKSKKLKVDINLEPNVGIFYFHPGSRKEVLKEFAKHYKGIVIACTGLGHVSEDFFETIEEIIKSNIPVVFASQTIYGRIDMDVYSTGRILQKIGVIGNHCDWTIETALVKLMFVLGHTKNMKEIKELMEKDIAGEISERIEYEL